MSTPEILTRAGDLATYPAARLAQVLMAVADLHCSSTDGDHCDGPVSPSFCRECGSAWPCKTVSTIVSKLET